MRNAKENEKKYAQSNEAALPLLQPEIRNDPVVFPPKRELQNGPIILPLSPEGEKRYTDLWTRFLADSK